MYSSVSVETFINVINYLLHYYNIQKVQTKDEDCRDWLPDDEWFAGALPLLIGGGGWGCGCGCPIGTILLYSP